MEKKKNQTKIFVFILPLLLLNFKGKSKFLRYRDLQSFLNQMYIKCETKI